MVRYPTFMFLGETDGSLQGEFSLNNSLVGPKFDSIAIAQIVAADNRKEPIKVFGRLYIEGGMSPDQVEYGNADVRINYSIAGIPEPSSIKIAIFGVATILLIRISRSRHC